MAPSFDSDEDLQLWLNCCDPIVFAGIAQLIDSKLSFRGSTNRKKWEAAKNPESVAVASSMDRADLSEILLSSLKYRGSHDIAYLTRKIFRGSGGVSYGEILRDVALGVAPKAKRKEAKERIPRVASVADREAFVCECLLGKICEGKKPEELKQMFSESGLDSEKAQEAAVGVAGVGVLGMGLPTLVRLVGKRTIKACLTEYLTFLLAKPIGKKAALKLVEQALGKVAQKNVAAAFAGIGYVVLAYDALMLLGPAKRITIPAVSMIATSRTMDRMGD